MLTRWDYVARLGVGATAVLLAACGGYHALAPVSEGGTAPVPSSTVQGKTLPAPESGYHHVQGGETLYSIAWRYGYDYQQLALWNNIKSPYRIYRGQRLIVRQPGSSAQIKSTPPAAPRQNTPAAAGPPQKPTLALAAPVIQEGELSNARLVWKWPAQGSLVRGASFTERGLTIAGRESQPIYAAAAGRVVYSGSGLVGLGKLVIIKHNESFLSAYAHNKNILVKEGDKVALGQPIAEMGKTGTDKVSLYFEIRKNGKPVDPLGYLPKRR